MTKPIEYQLAVAGFGVWRIAYDPRAKRWVLAYNVRLKGEQWVSSGEFLLAEKTAALAVADRKTGTHSWDGLRFTLPARPELGHWKTDASDGVQNDAPD